MDIIAISKEDLTAVLRQVVREELRNMVSNEPKTEAKPLPIRVKGLSGMAEFLGCSKRQAQRIKNSGLLDAAITQVGRSFTLNTEKAKSIISKNKAI